MNDIYDPNSTYYNLLSKSFIRALHDVKHIYDSSAHNFISYIEYAGIYGCQIGYLYLKQVTSEMRTKKTLYLLDLCYSKIMFRFFFCVVCRLWIHLRWEFLCIIIYMLHFLFQYSNHFLLVDGPDFWIYNWLLNK